MRLAYGQGDANDPYDRHLTEGFHETRIPVSEFVSDELLLSEARFDSEVFGGLRGQMRNHRLHGRIDDGEELDEAGERENSEKASGRRTQKPRGGLTRHPPSLHPSRTESSARVSLERPGA